MVFAIVSAIIIVANAYVVSITCAVSVTVLGALGSLPDNGRLSKGAGHGNEIIGFGALRVGEVGIEGSVDGGVEFSDSSVERVGRREIVVSDENRESSVISSVEGLSELNTKLEV